MRRMFIASLAILFLLPALHVPRHSRANRIPESTISSIRPVRSRNRAGHRHVHEQLPRVEQSWPVRRDGGTRHTYPLVGPDQMHPSRRGAVLTNIKLLSFVTLPAEQRVVNAKIDAALKEQRLFYCASGTGTIESAGKPTKFTKASVSSFRRTSRSACTMPVRMK